MSRVSCFFDSGCSKFLDACDEFAKLKLSLSPTLQCTCCVLWNWAPLVIFEVFTSYDEQKVLYLSIVTHKFSRPDGDVCVAELCVFFHLSYVCSVHMYLQVTW